MWCVIPFIALKLLRALGSTREVEGLYKVRLVTVALFIIASLRYVRISKHSSPEMKMYLVGNSVQWCVG